MSRLDEFIIYRIYDVVLVILGQYSLFDEIFFCAILSEIIGVLEDENTQT